MSSLSSDAQVFLPSMETLQAPPACRPRVVIVGAGMSGLSAAHRLTTLAPGRFDLTIIEASNRVGGRICSSTLNGELVEMGATWIHGIEGSPVHDIAQRMGLMHGDIPWECMDGFPESAVVIAEGRLRVPPHLVDSIGDLYKKLYDVIQYTEGGLQQFSDCESGAPVDKFKQLKKELKGASVGAYLWEGFKMHFAATTEEKSMSNGMHSNGHKATGERKVLSSWSVKALQEGVFRMRENVERSVTAADSMNDLDMESNDEYWEYPGEHKTIGHGYSSIIHFLASSLPEKTIQFNKEVTKISWLNHMAPVRIQCVDGTSYEADHVIITVSLGVLKASEVPSTHAKCVQLNRLFHPPLPPWKLDAISKLGFGVVDKCFLSMKPSVAGAIYPHMQLVFREEGVQNGCEDHGLADIPWWMRKNFSFYPIYRSSRIVCTWLTGKEAMEMEGLSDKEVIDGVVRTMESFGFNERIMPCDESEISSRNYDAADAQGTPPGSLNVEGMSRSKWGSNPLYRGSYSYVAVGSTGDDIDTLAEPLPRASMDQGGMPYIGSSPLQLLFAGEATHRYCYSTTHGAFLSGVREAERLAKHYGIMGTKG